MKRIMIASLLAAVFTVAVSADEKPDIATELAASKKKLAELREIFTDKHPKVQQQVQRVRTLEKQQQATK